MSKVKILVVEDEIVIADNICDILDELGYEVFEPAINYTEALELLEAEKPDLAMLDIQLAGAKDGIDLAWKIKEDHDIPFIFLTSNADPRTVERAKKLTPPAYLIKPFVKEDLYAAIELALYNHYGNTFSKEKEEEPSIIIKDAIFVKHKNLFQKVRFDDILFIKAEHVYVELYLRNNKTHLIRNSMNTFCEKLPENFFRVHRSYAINMHHLDAINNSYIIIDGGEVPIGKTYREELMKRVRIE